MIRPGMAKGPSLSGTPAAPAAPTTITGGSTSVAFGASPYTVLTTDTVLLVDTTGGNVTIQLPALATLSNRLIFVKMIAGTNTVTILPNGAETIDGFASYVISILNESVALHASSATPTKWEALARYSQFRSNDYVENWTAVDANWTYDGQEDFALFPGYLAAKVTAFNATATFAPTVSAFDPYPRPITGAFPLHIKHRIRSLAAAGVNTSLFTSFMLSDGVFTTDYLYLIWGYTGVAPDDQYILEIDSQKSGVPAQFVYSTGIPRSADREDDIEFVFYPTAAACYYNGQLIWYDGGFSFLQIEYVTADVQRTSATRQGLLNRTEIFTQAPNR